MPMRGSVQKMVGGEIYLVFFAGILLEIVESYGVIW